jgi:site-specific recombinase XerD
MSGKLRLGKTADSRTRRKPTVVESADKILHLQQLVGEQKNFVDYLLTKGFSTATTKRYIKDAEKFIEWIKKENVEPKIATYQDILFYIQNKKKTVSQRTISIIINSIKHFYNYLKSTGQVIENPTIQIEIKGVKRKILYHTLSKQELESIYNNFEIPKENDPNKNQNWFKTSILAAKRNKIIVGLMVYQGLNSNETKNLLLTDIKLREAKIFIAAGRRSNERELNLEAHQILDMMEYTLQTRNEILLQTKKQNNQLFTSAGNGEGFSNLMQHLINKLNQLNSKITSAKQIRTSVITQWLKLYNLRQVQYMAGHRYVSSTENYLVNDVEDLQDDITKYHPTN